MHSSTPLEVQVFSTASTWGESVLRSALAQRGWSWLVGLGFFSTTSPRSFYGT